MSSARIASPYSAATRRRRDRRGATLALLGDRPGGPGGVVGRHDLPRARTQELRRPGRAPGRGCRRGRCRRAPGRAWPEAPAGPARQPRRRSGHPGRRTRTAGRRSRGSSPRASSRSRSRRRSPSHRRRPRTRPARSARPTARRPRRSSRSRPPPRTPPAHPGRRPASRRSCAQCRRSRARSADRVRPVHPGRAPTTVHASWEALAGANQLILHVGRESVAGWTSFRVPQVPRARQVFAASHGGTRPTERDLLIEPVGRVDPAGLLVQLRALGLGRRLGDPRPLAIAGRVGASCPVLLGEELVDRVDVRLDRGRDDVRRGRSRPCSGPAARAPAAPVGGAIVTLTLPSASGPSATAWTSYESSRG